MWAAQEVPPLQEMRRKKQRWACFRQCGLSSENVKRVATVGISSIGCDFLFLFFKQRREEAWRKEANKPSHISSFIFTYIFL
jgi:hypothetical protein